MEKEVDDVTSPYSIVTATSDSSTPRPTSPTPDPSTPEPSAIPGPSTPGSSISTRKRKRPTKTDGAVIEIIEKMLERQSQSDMKVMELKEKQMLLEEKALEREMQQRREDGISNEIFSDVNGPFEPFLLLSPYKYADGSTTIHST